MIRGLPTAAEVTELSDHSECGSVERLTAVRRKRQAQTPRRARITAAACGAGRACAHATPPPTRPNRIRTMVASRGPAGERLRPGRGLRRPRAYGLMQLRVTTASRVASRPTGVDAGNALVDPATNITLGTRCRPARFDRCEASDASPGPSPPTTTAGGGRDPRSWERRAPGAPTRRVQVEAISLSRGRGSSVQEAEFSDNYRRHRLSGAHRRADATLDRAEADRYDALRESARAPRAACARARRKPPFDISDDVARRHLTAPCRRRDRVGIFAGSLRRDTAGSERGDQSSRRGDKSFRPSGNCSRRWIAPGR